MKVKFLKRCVWNFRMPVRTGKVEHIKEGTRDFDPDDVIDHLNDRDAQEMVKAGYAAEVSGSKGNRNVKNKLKDAGEVLNTDKEDKTIADVPDAAGSNEVVIETKDVITTPKNRKK